MAEIAEERPSWRLRSREGALPFSPTQGLTSHGSPGSVMRACAQAATRLQRERPDRTPALA